jgi:hypothetical protein
MGYEGFSRPLALQRMNPITGNRGEFLALFLLIASVPLIIGARKNNEEKLRSYIKTTNRYAELKVDEDSKRPSQWTL